MTQVPGAGDSILRYSDHLPLAWKPLPQTTDGLWRERLWEENLQILNAVAALEEHREPPTEAGPLEAEINRLHQKVDLLLVMVGGLIRNQLQLPEPVTLSLSAQDAVWAGDPRPGAGASGLVEIYLHRGVAYPLRLPAVIAESGPEQVRARFDISGEPSLAALERHVFVHHRRSVAGARHAAHPQFR